MSDFCLSFNENALNKILNAAYNNADIRSKLKGNTEIDLSGSKETISWDISQPPTVLFEDIGKSWEAVDINEEKLNFTPDMFCIETQTHIAVNGETGKNIPLSFVSIAYIFDTTVSFKIMGIRIDNYDSLDKGIIKNISHDLINSVNTSLGFKDDGSFPHLFSLDFLKSIGIHSNKMGLTKINRNIQVWGSDSGNNPYNTLSAISDNEFALRLSSQTLLDVLNKNFKEHIGECRFSGDFGEITHKKILGDNGRKVHVEVGVENIDAVGVNKETIDMRLKPSLNIHGTSAHLGIYGKFGYTSTFNPNPISAKASIFMWNHQIHCELSSFGRFIVNLDPWGFDAHILWPLTEWCINYITTGIPNYIRIPFDINVPVTSATLGGNHILRMNINKLSNFFDSNEIVINGCINAQID